jgi:hypothetical protein
VALAAAQPAGAAEPDVDMALVQAIDCSFSVNSREYELMMRGIGLAFTRAVVTRAIAAGARRRIAVAAFHWSETDNQQVILPWTMIAGDADSDEVGGILAATPRRIAPGGTGIGAALLYGLRLLSRAPLADRRVIDVSSDGRNNVGPPAPRMRDLVVAQGIAINGLVIRTEWPTLDVYFDHNVVGGDSHFVVVAENYEAYAEAIARKLMREIAGPGVV